MTNEECAKILADADKAFYEAENVARKERYDKRLKALNEWAEDNARFKVGDIIAYPNHQNIMRVDRIRGDQRLYRNENYGLYVTYYGTLLTKKLEPRKNDSQFSMYDDGREIIKIK